MRAGRATVMRHAAPLLLAALLAIGGCSSLAPKSAGRGADEVKATAARAEESYAKGEWATAAEAYAVLTEQMPQDANLWFRYANALARSDQPDRAVTAYREVLVRDAHSSKAWFNMGIVQLRQAANSFSRMESNVTADDPLRTQGQQVYGAILKVLSYDTGHAPAAKPATSNQGAPAPAPAAPVSVAPEVKHGAGGGAAH